MKHVLAMIKKNWRFLLIQAVLWSLFFLIKHKGYLFTEYLFDRQAFDLLNTISGFDGTHSLDFYIGEVENSLLGPIQTFVSLLAVVLFSLKYLPGTSTLQFGAAIMGYLLVTRPEILLYPPFGEGITGPFSDTVWLYQNNLNYFELLRQPTFTTGGPQIYPTALYPLFVAVVMRLIPSTPAFLVTMHLFYFFMAAASLATIRKICLMVLKNDRTAILTVVLILSQPLVQCMVELLNLEMPLFFFTVMTAYCLILDRPWLAGLSALGAIFSKDPGIGACAAVLAVYGLKFLMERPKKIRRLIIPAVVILIAGIKSVLRMRIVGAQQNFNMVRFMCGFPTLRNTIWFKIFLASIAVLFVGGLIRHYRRGAFASAKAVLRAAAEGLASLVTTGLPGFMMFLMTFLWFAVQSNFLTLAYRYQLHLIPFLLCAVVIALNTVIKKERVLHGLIIILILFSAVCSHGLMYETPHGVTQDNRTECMATNLERGLEYRNLIQLELALAREIETHFSDYAIVAPFQTSHELAIPQLGYVKKRLNVTVYGMPATLGIKRYVGIRVFDPWRTVWIGFPCHDLNLEVPFPIDPTDRILKTFERGHLNAAIFQGGVAIERIHLLVQMMEAAKRK